jgi:glycosyltransferase involved in cell wall biosynthesis
VARERVSAVVVVRDESRQIRECLRCLRFADEIVVVDSGSTDGTPAIARELAHRVVEFPRASTGPTDPPPLIHAIKNFAFGEAEGPWILNLDADERPTDALRDEILKVLEAPDPEVAAYAIPFTHYFFGRYLRHGGFRGPLVRLFRKGKLRYPEDRAHSTPLVEGRTGALEHLVVHFNHPRLSDFLRKMDLYTSQDAPLLARHGRGGLRNRPAPDPTPWRFLRGPLGIFWNRYVRHRGFLDGVHGLVAAVLLASYQFFETAKLWEHRHCPPGGEGAGARAAAGRLTEEKR